MFTGLKKQSASLLDKAKVVLIQPTIIYFLEIIKFRDMLSLFHGHFGVNEIVLWGKSGNTA